MLDIATRAIHVSSESTAGMVGVARFCRLGSLCLFDPPSTMADFLSRDFTWAFEIVIRGFDPVCVFCLLRGTASSTSESASSFSCSSSSEASVIDVTLLSLESGVHVGKSSNSNSPELCNELVSLGVIGSWLLINGDLSLADVGVLSLCGEVIPRTNEFIEEKEKKNQTKSVPFGWKDASDLSIAV